MAKKHPLAGKVVLPVMRGEETGYSEYLFVEETKGMFLLQVGDFTPPNNEFKNGLFVTGDTIEAYPHGRIECLLCFCPNATVIHDTQYRDLF